MNNKVKTNIKHNIQPKRRFPEFQAAQEWKIKLLGDLIYYENGKAHEQNISDTGKYIVVNSKFISTDGEVKKFTNDGLCIANKGDILMVLSDVPNGKAIAKCFLVEQDELYTVNQRICLIKSKNSISEFIYYIINRNPFYLNFDDGVKQTNLRKDDVLSCPIIVPSSKKEQQKIADCLSSIDELITAESKKLDALKFYKKSLMQQLFPAEGETLPKLRFPEFKDEGEWYKTTLGNCLIRKPEYGLNAAAVPFSRNLPVYIRITDISDDGSLCDNQKVSVKESVSDIDYLEEDDIVLARTGASVGKSYKYRKKDGKLVFAGFLIRIRPNNKKLNSELLFQYFFSGQYWKWVNINSARSGQPGINGNEYASLPLIIPQNMKEQDKIAACLSSVDDLTTNQNKKIDILKSHKKGLMQQLFPITSEL